MKTLAWLISPFLVILLLAATPNYIGPESDFTHTLKPLQTAEAWRLALGIPEVVGGTGTNIFNYLITTNLTVINTNISNVSIVTNLTVLETNINNYLTTTNLTVINTNISNISIVTNLTVLETNINNYNITTNLTVINTNVANYSIVTNLTVVSNFYSKPVNITSNIYVTNSYLLINGTNVATVNPTDLAVPARGIGGTNFIDTALHLDAPGSSNLILDGQLFVDHMFFNGLSTGVAYLIDQGDGSALLTNLVNASGVLTNDGSGNLGWAAVTAMQTNVAAANPTASVGLAAVNGSATTFMRSDGAPPLDVSIAPLWSELHKYSKNVGAVLSVGDTTFVDMQRASQTNSVSGALTFAHATNGLDGVDLTHVRWFFNSSGSDQTLTIPSGWKTNAFSAVPTKLTNAWITKMILNCNGPTASSATQTNVYVSFEYFK